MPDNVAPPLALKAVVDAFWTHAGQGGELRVLPASAGYADESHLIREFRALAGTTPTELARARNVGFVQAEKPAPALPSRNQAPFRP